MRYLQIFNLVLLALGLILTIVLAVECLLYAIYLGADPLVGRQLPAVIRMTFAFAALSAAAALAYFGHRGMRVWRWPAQLLPLLALAAAVLMLSQLRN